MFYINSRTGLINCAVAGSNDALVAVVVVVSIALIAVVQADASHLGQSKLETQVGCSYHFCSGGLWL